MLKSANIPASIEISPQMAIMPMMSSYWISQSIYVAAKLGIADLLKAGARNCEALAESTNTNPRALYRLMRALASVGIFTELEGGFFTLTPLAACLQSDVPDSLRSLAIISGEEEYQAWGDLLYSIQTGNSAFEHLYQRHLDEYHQQNPESGKINDHAMTNLSASETPAIAASYDFSSEISPQMAIMPMMSSYWISQSIYVAAKLGIADLLKAGARNCEALAESTNTNPRALYRLMRALASVGIFTELEGGFFTLTPLAACLQSDVPDSLRSLAIISGEEEYQAWGDLLYSIQTGNSAFEHLYQRHLDEYHQQNPESGKINDHAMTNLSASETPAIAASYDFSSIHRLVDVAGGQGDFITSILKANPTMQGILFDQASVIEGATIPKEAEGVADRCQLVAGDFFESVPSGGDAYMLKRILHNWDDRRAIAILKNCHRAMKANSKLLVIEPVIPPGNEPSFSKLLDLNVLVMLFPGACERTKAEFQVLFEAAGFELTQIIPATSSEVSIIEGIREVSIIEGIRR